MLEKLRQNKKKIYSFFIYIIVFLSSTYPYSDNDWGWHYKYGEYFFKHGQFLSHDIFTWTMKGFDWINPSLLYDPMLYILSNTIGLFGLSLVGGVVMVISFYLITSPFKLEYWKKGIIALVFIFFTQEGISEGFRSQSLSVLFFSALMSIILKSRDNLKFLFLLPVLFLIWANMHGDFISAYGVLGIFLGSYFLIDYYKTRKFPRKLFTYYSVVSLVSFFIAFINPHGYKIYFEFIRYFGNPFLKNILEWEPIYKSCDSCHPYLFSIYVVIFLAITIYSLMKRDLRVIPFLGIFAILVWPTIDTRRLTSVFGIITIPLIAMKLSDLNFSISKYKSIDYVMILLISLGIFYNLFTRFPSNQIYNYSQSTYCFNSTGCSQELVDYFKKSPPKGNGFNWYDIGGFLIGNNFPAKLFVDGRMGLWQKNGYFAFSDYIKMYYWQDYKLFNKYNFDWLLIQNDSNIAKKIYETKELGLWEVQFKSGNIIYMTRRR